MKLNNLFYPSKIVFFLCACMVLVSACEFFLPKQVNNSTSLQEVQGPRREVKAIQYIDEGAVVLHPIKKFVGFDIQDSLHGKLLYVQNNGMDSSKAEIVLSKERIDEVQDNLIELTLVPDNWVYRPGKMLCTGRNNVSVALIYSTGDTLNFVIDGGARCDSRILPAWFRLDSIAELSFSERNQSH